MRAGWLLLLSLFLHPSAAVFAQIEPAPARRTGEGEGPYSQLILRGATMITGTGAPAAGPVDIVVRGNRIERIAWVGYPGVPIDAEDRPKLESGGREIDLSGHYVLPGFVDMHGHIGGEEQGTPAEYVYKLWLGHGVTTVRDRRGGARSERIARGAIGRRRYR